MICIRLNSSQYVCLSCHSCMTFMHEQLQHLHMTPFTPVCDTVYGGRHSCGGWQEAFRSCWTSGCYRHKWPYRPYWGLQALPPLPSTLTLLAELMELQSHHPKVKTCGETKLVQHAGRCGSCFILLEICVRQPALR